MAMAGQQGLLLKAPKVTSISFLSTYIIACSRHSDSGARAKNKASERAGKKRGETGGEDKGTPVKFSQRKPFRYTRIWYAL